MFKITSLETNVLGIRWRTIKNLQAVLNGLSKEHEMPQNSFEVKLKSDFIEVNFLGKHLKLPYYKKTYGKLLNSDEIKENPFACSVYTDIKYNSLSIEEVNDLIIKLFTIEDKVGTPDEEHKDSEGNNENQLVEEGTQE
ncbi:MAG: hypothetical protein ACOCRO_00150 [Halanaerobiales bacterium]